MASSIRGTNCITERQDRIVNALANRTSFQAFCNVISPDDAKDHIFIGAVPEPEIDSTEKEVYDLATWQALFPMVVVGTPEDGGVLYEHSTSDSRWGYSKSFANTLLFQRFRTDGEANWQDALRNIENEVGNVIDELARGSDGFNIGASTIETNENAHFARYQNIPYEPMAWEWRVEADNRAES